MGQTVDLLRRIRRYNITDLRRCVLFVGSGASSAGVLPDGRGLPTWPEFAHHMIEDLALLGRINRTEENTLRAEVSIGHAQSYLHVASVYKTKTDAPEFESFMVASLDPDGLRPSELHRSIAEVGFRAIVTTNFDRLLELTSPRMPTYAFPDFLGRRDILQSTETILLKLHGSIVPALNLKTRFVLSSEDYVRLHDNGDYQEFLRSLILGSPVLVIGYSCRDPDFARIMTDLSSNHGVGPYVYVLLRRPEPALCEAFRAQNLKVIPYEEHGEIPLLFEELVAGAGPRSAELARSKASRRNNINDFQFATMV